MGILMSRSSRLVKRVAQRVAAERNRCKELFRSIFGATLVVFDKVAPDNEYASCIALYERARR